MVSSYFICRKFAENFNIYLSMPLLYRPPNSACENDTITTNFYMETDDRPITCKPWRELSGISYSEDDSCRSGHCLDLIEITEGDRLLPEKSFITPCKSFRSEAREIAVKLDSITSFDTAGAQTNLWLSLYLELKHGDFFGTFDRDRHRQLMLRRPQAGDFLLVRINKDSFSDSIIELCKYDNNIWHGILRHLGDSTHIQPNDDIYSIDRTREKEVSVEFRSRIGKILSLGSTCK